MGAGAASALAAGRAAPVAGGVTRGTAEPVGGLEAVAGVALTVGPFTGVTFGFAAVATGAPPGGCVSDAAVRPSVLSDTDFGIVGLCPAAPGGAGAPATCGM